MLVKLPKNIFHLLIFLICLLLIINNIYSEDIEVYINEISTNNNNLLADRNGNYSDWIELYNSGKNKVDISGYGLSNEFFIPFKWRFPENTIIEPGEYLIVFASEKKSTSEELHTNFKLYKNGDTLFFSDINYTLIEKVEIPALEENETYGRIDESNFKKMIPTPGKENEILIDPPIFSNKSGFYKDEFLLNITAKDNADIYYTIDGSDPLNSNTTKMYKKPILIYDRTEEPNLYGSFGEMPNSSISISIGSNYKTPSYLLDKAMVVRAISKNYKGHSKIIDQTYFITTKNLSLYENYTTISIVTNPDNLFDPEKGIYVTGKRYEEWLKIDDPEKQLSNDILNYFSRGAEWEREASITIFEKGKISVEQNMGLRIKGSSTRGNPGKSFNLVAKKKYGKNNINAKLFQDSKNYINGKIIDKYSSLSLICINSDGRLRNEISTKIIKKRIDLSTTEMKNGIVFLNGEYWGMYVISEKFTDDFIESHYNISKKNVAMNKQGTVEEGPAEEYNKFWNFGKEYSKKDLKDNKNYEEVCNYFDIDSLIEHYIAGIYLGTTDWPNYNYGVWRNMGEKIDGNKFSDGKWRFMTYDLDKTIGNNYLDIGGIQVYEYNMFNHTLRKMKNPPTSLFLALLQNDDFKNRFVNLFCDYVNDVMSIDKISELLDDYRENVTDMLANSLQRWRGYNRPYLDGFTRYKNQFYNSLDSIKTYFINRPNFTLIHMKEFLNLTGDYYELTIIKEGNGKIMINSIIPDFIDGKWKGKYFFDIPITIKAIESENNEFVEWSEDYKSKEKEIVISLENDMTIKANFE